MPCRFPIDGEVENYNFHRLMLNAPIASFTFRTGTFIKYCVANMLKIDEKLTKKTKIKISR